MIKITSQCIRTQQFVSAVEEEVRFIQARKLLLFFVEMGNCQSRLCCTVDSPETTPPKAARSEKSANLEMNSCNPNSERFFPYSVADRFNRINELCQKERDGWREVHSMMAEKVEEVRRVARRLKSATKNICDEDPSYAASEKVEDHPETATKSKMVDEETRREFLRQLHRTAWKDVNQRIMKARNIALARMENGVNQGASTSTESSSCNGPSSDEWLINHPYLFDAITWSEGDNNDEENCSQSSAAGHVAISIKLNMFFRNNEPEESSEEPEFSISPVQELHAEIAESKPEAKEGSASNSSILFTDHQPSTEGHDHRTRSPRPGALTRILRRRRNCSVDGLVSNSASEADESVLTPGQTPTPSPETRADSRQGRFGMGIYRRIAQKRRNRVHGVKSSGKSQSSSKSAIHGNSKSSDDRAFQSTPQASDRSSLTRAWLNILGRGSRPTSGRVTQIFVRPYDESQAENGRRLVPSPASVEDNTREEVSVEPSPVRSSSSGIVTFAIEDDLEVCSFTSSPTFDARSADIGGT